MKKLIIILITILFSLSIIYLYYLKIEKNNKISDNIIQDISLNKKIWWWTEVESTQIIEEYWEE